MFKQKKTKDTTDMAIRIDRVIEEIIKDGMPRKISKPKFNEYLNELCKMAEINEAMEGELCKT